MDWDTHRYLECFFAVPMMGAVLHTVNVRLSAEQILYTINHVEDDVILINGELLSLLQQIWNRVDAGKKLVLLRALCSRFCRRTLSTRRWSQRLDSP
jgi:fatty-acyl-CoA synthase